MCPISVQIGETKYSPSTYLSNFVKFLHVCIFWRSTSSTKIRKKICTDNLNWFSHGKSSTMTITMKIELQWQFQVNCRKIFGVGTVKGILNSALNHFAWICIPAANTDHQTQYIVEYLFIKIYWKWYFNWQAYFQHSDHTKKYLYIYQHVTGCNTQFISCLKFTNNL